MRTQPQDIVARLEATNSRIEKESILESAINEGCDEFFHGLQMCLDKLCTFGVKQVPVKKDESPAQGLDWNSFVELANKLRNRELTGHAARDAIELAMSAASTDQWNGYYRRILIKDLRAGVSEKTVNKVCKAAARPDLEVNVFSCQLAHDGAKHEKKIAGKKLIEGKLDGSRLLIVVDPSGLVECFSRNGKAITNFATIEQQFSSFAKTGQITESVVFDGEIMSSSFQDLMRQMHRKTDVDTSDAVYHVFDMIPLHCFKQGRYNKPQLERSQHLRELLTTDTAERTLRNVHVCGYEEVDLDSVAGKQRFNDINEEAIAAGLEGIMIKDPAAPYECKRTHSWLKIKPVITVDLQVVAVEEGTGRNQGKLGALVCRGIDQDREISVNVGSGLTDENREDFWQDPNNDIIGRVVEIEADAITQNQDGTYSLRFPRFKRFRGFAAGEKI